MPKGNKLFKRTGGLIPGRSVFDLSYEKKFTCDMGQLIPIMCDEVVPGDFFKIGNEAIIRMMPLVAPVLHEINVFAHYFFVPYRILWDDWEEFITRGIDGDQTPSIPEWEPTDTTSGSLWDFLGFPVGIDPDGAYPIDFPRRAYNLIYNEYYRDENLIAEELLTNESILVRCWEKDYFTSSLPFQQRGTAPALPIAGMSSAIFDPDMAVAGAGTTAVGLGPTAGDPRLYALNADGKTNLLGALNNNTVDLSVATTFDIADLRIAFQIQKWMERNARAGARYTEFLHSHFGVSPRDDRLQRPEYIGGSKVPIIVSEVLQTSQTDTTPQGTMAGHGLTASQAYCGKYHATEFGLIMGIMSIMPRTAYQQGIDKQWLRKSSYDFYFPEFANLSEQAIIQAELIASGVSADNTKLFGYAGRFDEMRIKRNMVCSEMRDTYDYWHLGRIFDPLNPPELNDDFVKCVPDKRIFAAESEPGLLVSWGNLIKAIRPLPIMAEPGLIDHH